MIQLLSFLLLFGAMFVFGVVEYGVLWTVGIFAFGFVFVYALTWTLDKTGQWLFEVRQ